MKELPHQTFLLGSAVKITSVLSTESPNTVTITIDDPSTIEKVALAVMTREGPKVYSYVYQSAETDVAGVYIATIRATYGSFTVISQEEFTLADLE